MLEVTIESGKAVVLNHKLTLEKKSYRQSREMEAERRLTSRWYYRLIVNLGWGWGSCDNVIVVVDFFKVLFCLKCILK